MARPVTFPLPPAGPAFDAQAFARRLAPAVERAGGQRAVARVTEVSHATLSRACRREGWPDLSHENYLRLTAWLETQQELVA